ncbi:MAG: hypothetical protein ABFS38_11925 [Bacteroidota bacterium]
MMRRIVVIINLYVLSLINAFSLAGTDEWKEIKLKEEVIIIKEAGSIIHSGQPFARKDEITYILVADDLGKTGEIALADLQKYLPLASGCEVKALKEKNKKSKRRGFILLLATTKSSELLDWAGLECPEELEEQECVIKPVRKFPDGTEGVVLVGGSKRGLLNGLYTLLEKSANVWWEPVRFLNREYPIYSNINETTLTLFEELRWPGKELKWKPVVKERIIYQGFKSATKETVNWASHNRLSHYVIATPHKLPMSEKEENLIKPIVKYAQELGLKVLFMNMTHRLPDDSPALSASDEEALEASTNLYLNQFNRFGLDGMAWHIASEGIHVHMDDVYKKRPRIEWEAKYFNAYYQAIRAVNEDALLVLLMGWVYMNPAEKLAELLPEDVIAWVVPNTPIIDAALTDLDSYNKYFNNIWYWLYVSVSKDGAFPMVKLDYLEKYFREAIEQGNNLAPQTVLGNNNENAMYYALSARDGIIPNQTFLQSFGKRYYGDPRMGEALIHYQEALKYHRQWYNNIHTRNTNNYLTWEERDLLRKVYRTSLDAAKKAKTPLIKNRLKSLTITAFRCLIRGIPSPYDTSQKEEFTEMITGIKSVFSDHYFGEEHDFIWNEFLELEKTLK